MLHHCQWHRRRPRARDLAAAPASFLLAVSTHRGTLASSDVLLDAARLDLGGSGGEAPEEVVAELVGSGLGHDGSFVWLVVVGGGGKRGFKVVSARSTGLCIGQGNNAAMCRRKHSAHLSRKNDKECCTPRQQGRRWGKQATWTSTAVCMRGAELPKNTSAGQTRTRTRKSLGESARLESAKAQNEPNSIRHRRHLSPFPFSLPFHRTFFHHHLPFNPHPHARSCPSAPHCIGKGVCCGIIICIAPVLSFLTMHTWAVACLALATTPGSIHRGP